MSPRATAWGAYRSITDALRARITDGEFAAGTVLPSEAVLRAEYHVARNTLRRALGVLAEEGLIVSQPGRGRVVRAPDDQGAESGPRSRRIAAELRQQIESGHLSSGDRLPSESALTRQYDVSRGTARQALAELEGAGLAVAKHGKGRFVT